MRVFRCAVVACVIGLAGGCSALGSADYGTDSDITLPKRPLEAEEDAGGIVPARSPAAPLDVVDAGSPVDGGTPADAAPPGPLRAFVSSTLVKGNAIGGLPGADAVCNNAAKAAGIPGNFTAWISTASTNAIDRIKANGPWLLVNGTTLAATKGDLAKGSLTVRFDKDEKGATPPADEDRVWTATRGDGTFGGPDCNGWTGGGDGFVGEAEQRDDNWTHLVAEGCGEVNRVYCLQQ